MSTYIRLELIEPSAREVFTVWTLVERAVGISEERRREHGSNLSRLETASELKKQMTPNLSKQMAVQAQGEN